MRLAIFLAILPVPALAHVGHLGPLAGHDHWVAGAGLGIAIGIGLWQAAKERKRGKSEPKAEPGDSEEEQPA